MAAGAGVWVAGNITDLRAQVMGAAADGLYAGAAINVDLIGEESRATARSQTERSA